MKVNDISLALQNRYLEEKGWVFLEEVRNRTGYGGSERFADAIAMQIWASRGYEVHGFEYKVSRSDVVKELNTPRKSAAIQKFCDKWWLVVGDKSIIHPNEVPKTWGLMIPFGKERLKVKVQAPHLERQPLTEAFIASVLRNVKRSWLDSEKEEIAGKAFREGWEQAEKEAERLKNWDESRYKTAYDNMVKLEKETGLNLVRWMGDNDLKILKTFRKFMKGVGWKKKMKREMREQRKILRAMKEAFLEIKEAKK